MDKNTSIVPSFNEETFIDSYSPEPIPGNISMYQAGVKWVETKFDMKSKSQKTKKAYKDALASFDMFLQSRGLALDSDARYVALGAQDWARSSSVGRDVSSGTINQRLAILSSFYQFAIKFGACQNNPIAFCERPKRQTEHDAPALDIAYVDECMKRIDRSSREGRRDYTFLTLALLTGRRSSELTGLQWKDCTIRGRNIEIKWARCKGGKVMHDILDEKTARMLIQFLQAEYGDNLKNITPDSYVFQSHSNNNQGGRLSAVTASSICFDRLGYSQVHVTRHTFAVNTMKHTKATLAEIGDQLGHSNLKTTSDYLKEKNRSSFKFSGELSSLFGIEE